MDEKILKAKWENDVGFAEWLMKREEKERYGKMARFWLWMVEEQIKYE